MKTTVFIARRRKKNECALNCSHLTNAIVASGQIKKKTKQTRIKSKDGTIV
jgi:hypothetical protein